MNRIVKEHYPVEKLPEDLRAEMGDARAVTLVIVPEARPVSDGAAAYQRLLADMATWRLDRLAHDSVARVRALRDEWDD